MYARNLIKIKNYSAASKICEDVVTNYPDSSFAYLALDLLQQSRIKSKSKQPFKKFVEQISNRKEKKQLYGAAELLLAVGERKDRISILDKIQNKYKGTPLVEFVLFQKFMYYLYEAKDIKSAKKTSDELGKLFPESESYFDSQRQLGKDVGNIPLQKQSEDLFTEKKVELPKSYKLLGNYPNPFNPSTTISYALPYSSRIELNIYDITGKVVKTFTKEVQSAGYHSIVWNGKNRNGIKVSSGVYLYGFKATSLENEKVFVKTSKMLLIK